MTDEPSGIQPKRAIVLSNPSTHRIRHTIAIGSLLIWYGLAIYLVLVTLGTRQFQDRRETVVATGSVTFASLKILASAEQSAGNAVLASNESLAAKDHSRCHTCP